MKFFKAFIICSSIALIALIIFLPRQLVNSKNENISLQRIYYESEQNYANELEVSDAVKKELLDFLAECKIYQTLLTTNTVPSQTTPDSDNAYYLYIRILDNKRSIGIHFFNTGSYIIVNERPFYYYFLDANLVQNEIFEILGITQ